MSFKAGDRVRLKATSLDPDRLIFVVLSVSSTGMITVRDDAGIADYYCNAEILELVEARIEIHVDPFCTPCGGFRGHKLS